MTSLESPILEWTSSRTTSLYKDNERRRKWRELQNNLSIAETEATGLIDDLSSLLNTNGDAYRSSVSNTSSFNASKKSRTASIHLLWWRSLYQIWLVWIQSIVSCIGSRLNHTTTRSIVSDNVSQINLRSVVHPGIGASRFRSVGTLKTPISFGFQ